MTLQYRTLPERRRGRLKAMLEEGKCIRAIEAHNPLSAVIGSTARSLGPDGSEKEFDALWLSGFTCASSRALPDIELSRFERRLETIEEIAATTSKPLIVDGDTGGDTLSFQYLCSRLEQIGASLVIIEDKVFPKRTSLAEGVSHSLEDPESFAEKIARGKGILQTSEMLIFARIESLIAGAGTDDALLRATCYLQSDADGIVIHSKDKSGEDVFAFLEGYRRLCEKVGFAKPLLCIPTAYNFVTDTELFSRGVSIVIHANHLLRAAYLAMQRVCGQILEHDRSLEVDAICIGLTEMFAELGVGVDETEKGRSQ